MAPVLLWLIMILCLLVSVVKYVMGIILKMSFPSAKVQKDYSYQPAVSVLMPCFNEGKTVYETIESISKSNYPAEKFEVIAQDDCSVDDSYELETESAARLHQYSHSDRTQRGEQRQSSNRLQRTGAIRRPR